MKTYHLFAYEDGARGGILDFESAFDSIEAAEHYLKERLRMSSAHIASFDESRNAWTIEREYIFSRIDISNPSSGYLEAFHSYRWLRRIYGGKDSGWAEL